MRAQEQLQPFQALIEREEARGQIILVCEHASNVVPEPWGTLGLTRAQLEAHIAWDPGALGLARGLSRRLDATLIHAPVSRLVYDCNRAPDMPGAMPLRSEIHDIPGNAVISAVGQLNQPNFPNIPGRDLFKGPSFHSARWDHSVDLKGKNVAVIGTGASAFQFVPKIAPDAGKLIVFQRSPPWLAPTEDYHETVGEGKKALLEHVPFYDKWYRFYLFWTMTDGVYEAVKADPGWNGPEGTISEASAGLRELLVMKIGEQTGGDAALFEAVTPQYPFGGKRALRDNGVWIEALRRPNVNLVTQPVTAVTEAGVVTADGTEHAADVLIYGTGFKASSFLTPMTVVGKGGVSLHDAWDGDARAYLGMTAPGFPNFFMLYGPNTNIVVNGSIIFFSEASVRYVVEALRLMLDKGAKAIEVKADVHDAFNARVDEANARMAWGVEGVSSWYKNAKGRVSQNWPFPLVDYWEATRSPNVSDFELT